MIGVVRRLPGLRLWNQDDVSAGRQPMVARQERHFISFLTRADGLRRNPLAIAAVTVSVATKRLVAEARRRFMGVEGGGKRVRDLDRICFSLPSSGSASAATGRRPPRTIASSRSEFHQGSRSRSRCRTSSIPRPTTEGVKPSDFNDSRRFSLMFSTVSARTSSPATSPISRSLPKPSSPAVALACERPGATKYASSNLHRCDFHLPFGD